MGIVTFNYTAWSSRYPELAAYTQPQTAQEYFNEACLYCDNSPCSPVQDVTIRQTLLNMLTAHICALNQPLGTPSSPLVGRISNATEGSVSVQTQLDMPPGSSQWYAQTKYGLAFWQATVQYRTFRYAAAFARAQTPVTLWPYGRGR